MKDVVSRALSAYYKTVTNTVYKDLVIPHLVVVKEKEYIVIENAAEILAVYRVRPNGLLKRMKRYPKEVGE